jgi:hypothetical protein
MTKGDSKNRVLSVRMWGVFEEGDDYPYDIWKTRELAESISNKGLMGSGKNIVRPVTVSWEEKKVGK